jgi:NADH-quinone oxidoreductase subunit N
MNMWQQLAFTAPELILSTGAIVLMLMAAWLGDSATRIISLLAVALLGAAAISLSGPAGYGGPAFYGLYVADGYGVFAKWLIYGAAGVCIAVAPRWFAQYDKMRAEYPVLILLAVTGMGMMVSAADLLTLYVGLELQSLAAYVLASLSQKDSRAAEAGLKYFVLGALASGILLYGISLLYGFSGTTHYAGIAHAMTGGLSLGITFGLVFVLAGLAFKIAAVPFHMWTPDVYEGAPTPVTMFFATAPKVAAVALLVRVSVMALGPATHQWQQIVTFSALASIILGAAGAIGQTNIKRLLAYSSINNIGFVLVGLAAGTPEGVSATLFYLAVYVVTVLGSFLAVMQLRDTDGNAVESIASLAGLSQTRKGLAAAIAVFMFSLAGIPPLFGFWPKLLVFWAALNAGLFPLVVIGFIASVVGAFYYLRVIKVMYFDPPANVIIASHDRVEGGFMSVSAVFLAVGYPLIGPLGVLTAAAAKALLR